MKTSQNTKTRVYIPDEKVWIEIKVKPDQTPQEAQDAFMERLQFDRQGSIKKKEPIGHGYNHRKNHKI